MPVFFKKKEERLPPRPERRGFRLYNTMRSTGLSLERLLQGTGRYRGSRTLTPIEAKAAPTYIKWCINNDQLSATGVPVVKLYPGQKYAFTLKFDGPSGFWRPDGKGRIRLTTSSGVHFSGGKYKGGYIQCHFQCLADAEVGDELDVCVKVDPGDGSPLLRADLCIQVMEKKEKKEKRKPSKTSKLGTGSGVGDAPGEAVEPLGITSKDQLWNDLDWALYGKDVVGVKVRLVGSQRQVIFNAENSVYLEALKASEAQGLKERFMSELNNRLTVYAALLLSQDVLEEHHFDSQTDALRRHQLEAKALLETLVVGAMAASASHRALEKAESATQVAA